MTTDVTVEILKQIRDEARTTNERLEAVVAGMRSLEEETHSLREETTQRLDRVETGLNDLGKFMRQIALDQDRREHARPIR